MRRFMLEIACVMWLYNVIEGITSYDVMPSITYGVCSFDDRQKHKEKSQK